METKEKRKLNIFWICPAAHIVALISGAVIIAHLLLRRNYALMQWLSLNFVRPVHRFLSVLWSHVPFSVAEVLIGVFAVGIVLYIAYSIVRLVRGGRRLQRLYSVLVTLAAAGLFVYALFCMLWGVYYYGDDFETASGLKAEQISADQLEIVTRYFAQKLNEYGELVPREEHGFYVCDRKAVLAKSPEVFAITEQRFPCLAGPDIAAKGVHFSRIMSYLDFTGFLFPFTAEANVNTDFPPSGFASTVAHELSHQRGVAKEQEANFVGIMACLDYGDLDYCYSACQLAYTHLGNALHKADYERWEQIYNSLSDEVKLDMALNRAYWKQFETPVQTVSNTVYEGFLYSYEQNLGLRSYGACVDLLVNYYEADAEKYFQDMEIN